MEIQKVIIHEIIKHQRVNEAQVFLTNASLRLNDQTISLIETLDKSFKRDVINYAIFNEEGQDDFPHYFKQYNEGEDGEREFVIFTQNVIRNLQQIIRNVLFAKGGYFVFAKYVVNATLYVGVFLIRDEKGILFNKDRNTQSFTISPVSYLNTSKLAMGCRINIPKYIDREGRFVAMIKNNQADISQYFYNWINVIQPESSTEFTNALFQIISNIPAPLDPDTNVPLDLDVFRKDVHDYIKTRPNQVVNLMEMGSHFYNDETAITSYVDENDYNVDTEFKVDGRSLKKFCTFDVRADGIRLLFSRGDFENKVRLSEENQNMVIIESKSFASKLRNESAN